MKIFSFIFTLLSVFVYIDYTFANTQVERAINEIEPFIEAARQEWGAPGVAVVIVKDGQIIYEKGFGTVSINDATPITPETVFQIASVTKTFLATLIGHLVDEGKLSFDDPVRKYAPDFFLISEEASQRFTLRDLISHCSGLPAFSGDTLIHMGFTQHEVVQGLSKIKAKYPPRSHYGYQNHLFGIASLVVEKATGERIEDLLTKHIFNPLGMVHTSTGLNAIYPHGFLKRFWNSVRGKTAPVVALPHDVLDGKTHTMAFNPEVYTFPGSTGINATIHDLGLWLLCQLNGGTLGSQTIISPARYQELRTPHIAVHTKNDQIQFPPERVRNIHYGMGWFTYDYGEGNRFVPIVSHMGGLSGGRSLMVMLPTENLGIVILSNLGSMRVSMLPEAIRDKFLGLYLGLNDQNWSTRNLNIMKDIRQKNADFKTQQKLSQPAAAQKVTYYEGTYESPLYGPVVIEHARNGLLHMTIRGRTVPLTHWNRDEFSFNGVDLSPYYGDAEPGFIEFGGPDPQQATLCAINLLHEGDGLFNRAR
jgi:CubicO group peptidase (beta-lactamase class C family)